jgi:hypothetical protein
MPSSFKVQTLLFLNLSPDSMVIVGTAKSLPLNQCSTLERLFRSILSLFEALSHIQAFGLY